METGQILLVSRKDSARALGISLRTLDTLVSRREIRARRIGRRVLFERREIERFAGRDHGTRPLAHGNAE
jgi:excisionase family DNA binding protein